LSAVPGKGKYKRNCSIHYNTSTTLNIKSNTDNQKTSFLSKGVKKPTSLHSYSLSVNLTGITRKENPSAVIQKMKLVWRQLT